MGYLASITSVRWASIVFNIQHPPVILVLVLLVVRVVQAFVQKLAQHEGGVKWRQTQHVDWWWDIDNPQMSHFLSHMAGDKLGLTSRNSLFWLESSVPNCTGWGGRIPC